MFEYRNYIEKANPSYFFVVPYRGRPEAYKEFMKSVPSYLKKTFRLPYFFVIVEQVDPQPFNLGALINCGYTYFRSVLKIPKHVSDVLWFLPIDVYPIKVDYLHNRDSLLVLANKAYGCKTSCFEFVNGYSNNIFGYGADDSCIEGRFRLKGLSVEHRVSNPKNLFWKTPPIFKEDNHPDKRFITQNENLVQNEITTNDFSSGLSTTNFHIRKEYKYFYNVHHIDIMLPPIKIK